GGNCAALCKNDSHCSDGSICTGGFCRKGRGGNVAICGNATLEGGEACDDGNKDDGDYCSADCRTVTGSCGDGVRQSNEACDDGGQDECGACNATCTAPGDGRVLDADGDGAINIECGGTDCDDDDPQIGP